jgi:hypothetical protein
VWVYSLDRHVNESAVRWRAVGPDPGRRSVGFHERDPPAQVSARRGGFALPSLLRVNACRRAPRVPVPRREGVEIIGISALRPPTPGEKRTATRNRRAITVIKKQLKPRDSTPRTNLGRILEPSIQVLRTT